MGSQCREQIHCVLSFCLKTKAKPRWYGIRTGNVVSLWKSQSFPRVLPSDYTLESELHQRDWDSSAVNCLVGRVPKPESWLAPSGRRFPWMLPTVEPVPPGPLNRRSSQLCAGHRSYGRENTHFLRISLGLSELTLAVFSSRRGENMKMN